MEACLARLKNWKQSAVPTCTHASTNIAANKASSANAGLKWIEKGGGYYSECNKRLKGAA
jgi:hypothetical protein